ncbi:MAG: hypothetical protein H7256_16400 [Bdellovibrio sp.]|nr:hypothetical protein [Bdellovibrio sp.]
MSSMKISKRAFIRNLSAILGLVAARQALAVSILEEMSTHQPNQFQTDIMKDPKKQKLIAETADCVGYPPFPNPSKLKCLSGD